MIVHDFLVNRSKIKYIKCMFSKRHTNFSLSMLRGEIGEDIILVTRLKYSGAEKLKAFMHATTLTAWSS